MDSHIVKNVIGIIYGYYIDYPELRLGGRTYHWLRESFAIGNELIEKAGEIDIPLLLLEAGKEKVISNRKLKAFCHNRQKSKIERELCILIEGAHHERYV